MALLLRKKKKWGTTGSVKYFVSAKTVPILRRERSPSQSRAPWAYILLRRYKDKISLGISFYLFSVGYSNSPYLQLSINS